MSFQVLPQNVLPVVAPECHYERCSKMSFLVLPQDVIPSEVEESLELTDFTIVFNLVLLLSELLAKHLIPIRSKRRILPKHCIRTIPRSI